MSELSYQNAKTSDLSHNGFSSVQSESWLAQNIRYLSQSGLSREELATWVVSILEERKADNSAFEDPQLDCLLAFGLSRLNVHALSNLVGEVSKCNPAVILRIALSTDATPEFVLWAEKAILASDSEVYRVDASSARVSYAANCLKISEVMRYPNALPGQVALALKIVLIAEPVKYHLGHLVNLHPDWRRDPDVAFAIFTSNPHTSYLHPFVSKNNDFKSDDYHRIASIVSVALSEHEDPRSFEPLREVVTNPISLKEFKVAVEGAAFVRAPWLSEALVELMKSPTSGEMNTYALICALVNHGGPDSCEGLRLAQKRTRKWSEQWCGAVIGLARHGDQQALEDMRNAIRKGLDNFWAFGGPDELVKYIADDMSGKFTRAVWEGITESGKMTPPNVLIAIGNAVVDGDHIVSHDDMYLHLVKELSKESLDIHRFQNLLITATDLYIVIPDQLFADLIKKFGSRPLCTSVLATYADRCIEMQYPLSIDALLSSKNLELNNCAARWRQFLDMNFTDEQVCRFDIYPKRSPLEIMLADPARYSEALPGYLLRNQKHLVRLGQILNAHFLDPEWREAFVKMLREANLAVELSAKTGCLHAYADALEHSWDLGIKSPFRFSMNQLPEIVANRQNLSVDLELKKPVAVFFVATYDHNGAFANYGQILSRYAAAGYKVIYFEISDKDNLIESIEEFRLDYGTARALWISAHSNPRIIAYDSVDDMKNLSHADHLTFASLRLSDTIEEGGQLILNGCSTRRPIHGELSIGICFEYSLYPRGDSIEVVSTDLISRVSDYRWKEKAKGDLRVSING